MKVALRTQILGVLLILFLNPPDLTLSTGKTSPEVRPRVGSQKASEQPPRGVPRSARWAGSEDGGAWIVCRSSSRGLTTHCLIYNQTGGLSSEGDFVLSDTKRAATRQQLVPDGFDGSRIYLADGSVLEPVVDPFRSGREKGLRCEAKAYDMPVGPGANLYCYRLQEWLIEAAERGNVEQIKKALAAGANIEGTYYSSFPALHTAAMMGRGKAVEFLLNRGAQVNRVVNIENTPLKMAVAGGHTEVVKLLLQGGADPCYETDAGTAEEIARQLGNKDAVELLKAASPGEV